MKHVVTATQAARNLSDLLNRVRYLGEAFEIRRGGEVVAELRPPPGPRSATVGRLFELLQEIGPVDPAFGDDLDHIQAEQPPAPGDPWER